MEQQANTETQICLRPETTQQIATLETFALDADLMLARKGMLQQVMKRVMQEGTHFGKIPGCGDKPTLLKPGAEAISSTFQLCPRYNIVKTELPNDHREYEITCELLNPVGGFIGSGVGSATTMEGKYRFRKSVQNCPSCGKETIRRSKQEYGGGWYCSSRDGGCNAKFSKGDPSIESQDIGRVEHDNPADYYNTVLKMAKKRAFVDAVLTATGASDIFTQDIENMPEVIPGAAQQKHDGQGQTSNGGSMPQGMGDLPHGFGQPGRQGQPSQTNGPICPMNGTPATVSECANCREKTNCSFAQNAA